MERPSGDFDGFFGNIPLGNTQPKRKTFKNFLVLTPISGHGSPALDDFPRPAGQAPAPLRRHDEGILHPDGPEARDSFFGFDRQHDVFLKRLRKTARDDRVLVHLQTDPVAQKSDLTGPKALKILLEFRGKPRHHVGVNLVGENELVTSDGSRTADQGKANKASRIYTKSFTEHFPKIAEKVPVYASLRNLIDMSVVAA